MGFWEAIRNAASDALRVEPRPYDAGAITTLANNGVAWTEIAPAAGAMEVVVRPQDPTHALKVGSSAAPGTAYELVPAGLPFDHPCIGSVWVQLSAAGSFSVRTYS